MARYPLWSTAHKGRSVHVSAQRRVNMYADFKQSGDRSQLNFYGTPGLVLFTSLGDEPVRGLLSTSDTLYAVHRGTLYAIDNAGTATSKGSLSTNTGRVGMAFNGSVVVIVDGDNGYTFTVGTDTFATIVDADFPGADTVDFQGAQFIVNKPGTGQFYVSANGTDWDALDFASAESFPDDIVSVFVERGQLLLFGEKSAEFWSNVGATDFPFARVDGAVVEYGLAARWSVAKAGNAIIFLAKNRTGNVEPILLDGYTAMPAADSDVEYTFNTYATVSDATALAYKVAGHTFYQLNFPSAGKSWLFDINTRLWSELEYGATQTRHRAEIGAEFIDKIVVSDYQNGSLYRMDADTYTDNGVTVAREIIGRHVFDEEHITVGRLWLDIDTGVGAGDSDPQAMLSISKDGGHTYGREMFRSIGKIGRYTARTIWRALGRGYEWTFRLRITEPVKVAISGAWIDSA